MQKQIRKLLPGLILTTGIGVLSMVLQAAQKYFWGRVPLEGLVLAIIIGIAVRAFYQPPSHLQPGIRYAAKPLLEFAVALLGASIDVVALRQAGFSAAAAIICFVIAAIFCGFWAGRLFGLPSKLAILVACGNAICGNSAIAAIAPVIEAEEDHTAAAVAFTALLGTAVMIGLPLLAPLMQIKSAQFGILAGLTVYAVPQVLAATSGAGAVAMQTGTLVKLIRVLMLGPVIFFLTIKKGYNNAASAQFRWANWQTMVPPFILGFVILAIARATGIISPATAGILREAATILTILSMAGLGLMADLCSVRRSGRPVMMTAACSLGVSAIFALMIIRLLHG